MSRMTPYSPIGPQAPIAGPADHERMKAILEKHSKSGVKAWPSASEPAPAPPPRTREPLKWRKPESGATGVYTECQWYSCCKVMLGGKWTYEVWTRQPLVSGMTQLAVGLASFDEAKAIAQTDADSKVVA